jgi:hypothetical protein
MKRIGNKTDALIPDRTPFYPASINKVVSRRNGRLGCFFECNPDHAAY